VTRTEATERVETAGGRSAASSGGFEIALFAGEPSGDLMAAALLREIFRQACGWRRTGSQPLAFRLPEASTTGSGPSARPPLLRVWGIGGLALREAGVQTLYDSTRWGAIGIAEALKLAPRLLGVFARTRRELARRRPDLVILVDFGAFNARLGRYARSIGLPVFYYFPPGSWRRDGRTAARLRDVADRVATPFPWSAENLRAAGIDAHFVGHPLVDAVLGAEPPAAVVRGARICYLPGSRTHEIRDNGSVMVDVARLLSERDPSLSHVVVQSPGVDADLFDRVFSERPVRKSPSPPLFEVAPAGDIHEVLAESDVVVTKAGTVTLEVALHKRPMVVFYRGSFLQELEYRLLHARRIRFIAMPNILMERMICPELIQRAATPERVAALAWALLTDPLIRERTLHDLEAISTLLGPPGANARAARLALSLIPTGVASGQ
jgi:lipid-A-disaccharide synthase